MQLFPFPLENSALRLRQESTTGLVFSAPSQVPQCHLQVTVLWYTLTSCCLTRAVLRAGLHKDTSTPQLSCSNPPNSHQHTEIKRMGPQPHFWNSPTPLQRSLAEQGSATHSEFMPFRTLLLKSCMTCQAPVLEQPLSRKASSSCELTQTKFSFTTSASVGI